MKYIQKTIFLLLIVLGFSCSVKKEATVLKSTFAIPEEYKAYTSQHKGNVLLLTNTNETTPKMPVKFLELVLIDTLNNEVFFKDQIREGAISWVDEKLIKVSYTPGNPQVGNEYFYYYNIETRKIIYKNALLKSK